MIFRRFAILELNGKINLSKIASEIKVSQHESVFRLVHSQDDESLTLILHSDIILPIEENVYPSINYFSSVNSKVEKRIEIAAALISVSLNASKKLRSSFPCFALKAENSQDREFLDGLDDNDTSNLFSEKIFLKSAYLPLNEQTSPIYLDRIDGVISFSEVLSSNTAISQFKELIRFFEIAFGATFISCIKKIFKTIESSGLGYTQNEIRNWYKLRGGAIHGDRSKSDLVYESEVMHVVERIIQAAIIVLIRKKNWHKNDGELRNEWIPPFRTDNEGKSIGTTNEEIFVDMRESSDVFGSWLLHGIKGIHFDPTKDNWWVPGKDEVPTDLGSNIV
ncbi:hypothetical protein MAMP_02519 [Methylophaga aminisulfidivorans MP]|uniref:Apea-like HEPN domain-containing protein n=1 Tax=Methylophaga aminisulfidivorans MP TaxID=1026882 RepID=F5SUF7_9GAMM|nr:hypothetical protein [Methylophaga aminisulfidivorans]EGL55525.1 hypothetical protein MAMP_02519 [Methylophaga aminisulfidivorans MP]